MKRPHISEVWIEGGRVLRECARDCWCKNGGEALNE